MPVVDAKSLHKAYGAQVVLRAVDVTIRSGERVGIVGRNGAGKSTLARILAGVEQPDAGNVARRRGAQVEYLEQVPVFPGNPTAREAVAAGLTAWNEALQRHAAITARIAESAGGTAGAAVVDSNDAHVELLAEQTRALEDVERLGGWDSGHRVDTLLDHLGVPRPDARVSELSGGEQRRVALARILVARPMLAVLDEPTNHLDAETIEWLEEYLIREHSGAILLITHDRYLLDRVAQRTLEVSDGEVHSYDGGYELYLEKKAEREAHAARTEQNRQNFLRRELEWLRRQPKARTTKQKARIDRAHAAQAAPSPKNVKAPVFEIEVARTGKTILELEKAELQIGGTPLVRDFDLFLTQGERVGIVGRNGAGKTTLLRAVTGQHPLESGRLTLGANTKLAYFDQHREGLKDDESIFDNIVGDQSEIRIGGQVIEPHAYIERFGFTGYKQRQPVGALSGGERARVALARLLRQSANLILLDEPTNDLDVDTLAALEAMLIESAATVLVVTHDRWFLDRVATTILAFEGDGVLTRYSGNYSTYRRLRAQAAARPSVRSDGGASDASANAAPDKSAKVDRQKNKKRPALTWAERKELAELPDAIERAEARVETLTAKLSDPATYAAAHTDGSTDVAKLTTELDEARKKAERLFARWEELETKNSGDTAESGG